MGWTDVIKGRVHMSSGLWVEDIQGAFFLTHMTELFRASVGLNIQVALRYAALTPAAYTVAVTYVTMKLHEETLSMRFQ